MLDVQCSMFDVHFLVNPLYETTWNDECRLSCWSVLAGHDMKVGDGNQAVPAKMVSPSGASQATAVSPERGPH